MPLEVINPDTLYTPQTYSHVIRATGSRMVFIAGQLADDLNGEVVAPDDLPAQAHQAFTNLGHALRAAGAHPHQVTKLTIYVVSLHPTQLPHIEAARTTVFGPHKPTDALIGVQALALPHYLIEVDAIAVCD